MAKIDSILDDNIYPPFAAQVKQLYNECIKEGIPIDISSGYRSYAEQQAIYDRHDGSTQAKGGHSQHNWGVAVDFYRNDGKGAFNDNDGFFTKVGRLAEKLGIGWGGAWVEKNVTKTFVDKPHIYSLKWGLQSGASAFINQFGENGFAQFKSTWSGGGGVSTGGAASGTGITQQSSGYSGSSGSSGSSGGMGLSGQYVVRSYSPYSIEYETKTVEYDARVFKTANATQDLQDTSLLTYPTLVESPFIQLKVGNYTFGTYKKETDNKVKYPNYIQGMTVKKTNGQVNEYTITLVHQIEAGADPNIVDKILSSISSSRLVYISYGDYNAPSFTYKEEEALLISSSSNTDFAGSKITYTLQCTSNATQLYAKLFNFDRCESAKPSEKIIDMLWGSGSTKYGLLDAFPGMKNKTSAIRFLANDDIAVTLEAKTSTDPISYINYLVSCMCSSQDSASDVLKSATYKMAIFDTTFGGPEGINGAYFKIVKISTNDASKSAMNSNDIYEIDVGYPTDNMVLEFSVKEDQTWSLLYNYAGDIKEPVYNLTADGKLKEEYLPRLAISQSKNTMTEVQKTWWTNMTKFPISATLKLKGLVKPAMLTTYVRINAVFYGQQHISSGLYFITAQTDSVNSQGYRTELELQRIAGYNEYLTTEKRTKTEVIPTRVIGTSNKTTTSYTVSATSDGSGSGSYGSGGYSDTQGSSVNRYTYQTDPYTASGDANGCTDPMVANKEATAFAICAAIQVTLGSNNLSAIKWATSAVQNRISDLQASNMLVNTIHFYHYIHCTTPVIQSYRKASSDATKEKYRSQRHDQYEKCAGILQPIFKSAAAMVYDVAIEQCLARKERSMEDIIPYNTTLMTKDLNGSVITVSGIDKAAVSAVQDIICNGTKYTTANYFSTSWRKLTCGSKELRSGTAINNSMASNIGTGDDVYLDSTYWQIGVTKLISADDIECTYVGHIAKSAINLPAFAVQSTIVREQSSSSGSSSSGSTSSDEKSLWNALRNAGYTAAGAAGVLGNILREGGLNPKTVEGTFCEDLRKNGSQTSASTSYNEIYETMTNFMSNYDLNNETEAEQNKLNLRRVWMKDGQTVPSTYTRWGYGMVQWTDIDRKKGLIRKAKSLNQSVGSAIVQTQWIIEEMQKNYPDVHQVLCSTNDYKYACERVFTRYEGPGDSTLPARESKAEEIYNKYKNQGTSGSGGSSTNNDTAFIGDSRTVGMQSCIESKYFVSAKVGEGFEYMINTAIPAAENNNRDKLVILFGVNDLPGGVETAINQYCAKFSDLNTSNKFSKLYFVSVNKVDDSKAKYVKNADIEKFNKAIKEHVATLNKFKYIDTYNTVTIKSFDAEGLHYDSETYKAIYDKIIKSL